MNRQGADNVVSATSALESIGIMLVSAEGGANRWSPAGLQDHLESLTDMLSNMSELIQAGIVIALRHVSIVFFALSSIVPPDAEPPRNPPAAETAASTTETP